MISVTGTAGLSALISCAPVSLWVMHGRAFSQLRWLVPQMIPVKTEMDEEEMTLSALLSCSLVPIAAAAAVGA